MKPLPSAPSPFPAYYDHKSGLYLLDAEHGWTQFRKDDLKQHMRLCGWSEAVKDAHKLTLLDKEILRIQTDNKVDHVGPVAGHRKGLKTMGGSRILVTQSFTPLAPRSGEWPLWRQCIDNLLGRVDELQTTIFYSWCQIYLLSLQADIFMPGQMIFFVGPHDCGKSFVQNMLTVLFGGRSANPWQWISGATEFNSEMFGSEHLQIEDPPVNRISDRLDLSAKIKQLTVNQIQPCHGKNRDIVTIQPRWRVTGSVNDEPYNIRAIPPIDDSTSDKINIFKCAAHSIPCTSNVVEERERFRLAVEAELPHFAHFLLHEWQIPERLKSGRFGVTHYQHPEILAEINSNSPEFDLLTTIDENGIFEKGKGVWTGSVKDLATALRACFNDGEAQKLASSERSLALRLASLARKYPLRCQFKRTRMKRLWVIYKDELGES